MPGPNGTTIVDRPPYSDGTIAISVGSTTLTGTTNAYIDAAVRHFEAGCAARRVLHETLPIVDGVEVQHEWVVEELCRAAKQQAEGWCAGATR